MISEHNFVFFVLISEGQGNQFFQYCSLQFIALCTFHTFIAHINTVICTKLFSEVKNQSMRWTKFGIKCGAGQTEENRTEY